MLKIGEGIAKIGENERELTVNEYNYANQVFKGTLPPQEDIILTDTIGGNDRAFTMPRFDGKVTINMGENGYDNPLDYEVDQGRIKGQVFIHELTHAWQIKNTHWELGILAGALANKICEAAKGSDAPYIIGTNFTKPFSDFNLEQQAKIVELWFIQCELFENGDDCISSPFYHYIEGNIRIGQP